MLRRAFKVFAAIAFFSIAGSAFSKGAPYDVVKVMSFSCPICREAESQDPLIAKAVQAQGGKFEWAPVPTDKNDVEGAPEKVYYASRAFGPVFSAEVKASIYKAVQDLSVPMYNFPQVYAWLSQDLPAQDYPTLQKLEKATSEGAGVHALSRAATLAINAGVSHTPGYVILRKGRIVRLDDPTVVRGGSLLLLRQLIVQQIQH